MKTLTGWPRLPFPPQYPICKCGAVMDKCFIWAYGIEQTFFECPACGRTKPTE